MMKNVRIYAAEQGVAEKEALLSAIREALKHSII